MMGMELLVKKSPDKKWYIILDDDTFFVKSSLRLLLSRLDPTEPMYIGNAVGDYRTRFAHGGSGVIISGEAMRRLFNSPRIVAEAYLNSLEETWGDRLVALTLQKLGVYLDERFSHHFNGEDPQATRISADKFCSPLLSFHEVRGPDAMSHVAETLRGREAKNGEMQRDSSSSASAAADERDLVRWGSVWELFGDLSLRQLEKQPARSGRDYIGRKDENTRTWKKARTSAACSERCARSRGWCLAWTFEPETGDCHGSNWMTIGVPAGDGVRSGVIWERIRPLVDKCLS